MSKRLAFQQVVSESMIHIIEPIADQALRYIIHKLDLPKLLDEVHIVSDFKEVSKVTNDDGNAKIINYRAVARLTPSVNPSNNKWEGTKTTIDLGNGNTIVKGDGTMKKRPWTGRDIVDNNAAIFHDPATFVDLTEWNVASTLAMEVKFDFPSLTDAQDCLSRIFAFFTNGDMIGYIPLQYDYPIPKNHQMLLKQIYSMTNNAQTTAAFKTWLHDKSNGTISFNTNRNNINVVEMVGLRNNAQALYLIECTQDAPEVGNTRYTITFNMTVQYSRTNRIVMEYPIIINNQLLDFKWVPMDPNIRTVNYGPYQWQNKAVDDWWHQQYKTQGPIVIKYPWWDPWEMPDSILNHKGYKPIFTAAVTIDDTQRTSFVKVGSRKIGDELNLAKDPAPIACDPTKEYFIKNEAGSFVSVGHLTSFKKNTTYYIYETEMDEGEFQLDQKLDHYTKETELVTVLDLKEGLPGYKLSNEVLAELNRAKSQALYTVNTYVNVSVFAHDYQVDPSLLEFDGRYLTIKSRRKEPIYRLVISLNDKPVNMPHINWVWITTIIVKKGN